MTSHVGARRRRAPAPGVEPGGSVVVLTATARLARDLGERHDAEQILAGRSAWPSPQILPFDAWIARLWESWLYSGNDPAPLRLLCQTAEQAVWEDILQQSPEGHELLEIPGTAEVALRAWNLVHRWELAFDTAEWRDSEDSEAFLGWAVEFQDRCRANHWLSGAELAGFVADRIRSDAIDLPEEVIVAGFDELVPAYQHLLDALEVGGVRVDVRDGWWGGPPDRTDHEAVRVGFSAVTSEIRAAASWARQTVTGFPHRDGAGSLPELPRIGVVVPDLRERRDEIERIFRDEFCPGSGLRPERDHGRPFNISLGPRLADYPVVESALDLLRMDPDSIPLEDAGRLLQSPFVGGFQREAASRSLLFRALRSRREPQVDTCLILALAGDVSRPWHSPELVERLRVWAKLRASADARMAPSEWPPLVLQLLGALGWPGDRAPSSSEYQTVEAWREVLSELAGLDSVVEKSGLPSVVSVLGRIARSRQFQPESDPAPVQILGLLEAGGLEFDRLWIMGMDAASWPRSEGSNPFLPLSLQRLHDMPDSSPGRHLDFARRLSDRLLSSVRAGSAGGTDPTLPPVVVSYPQREPDSGIRPSPLFAHLREASCEDVGLAAVSYVERVRSSSRLEAMADDRGPVWTPGPETAVPGGTRVFADQAACGFRAFARARLGASDSEPAASLFDAMDRGVLIHDVLDRVWAELGSHDTLVSLSEDVLGAMVQREVVRAIEAMSDRRSVLRRGKFREIEQDRLVSLVVRWLEVEKRRGPFRVVEREVRNRIELGGLPVIVRADRVDELEDGSRVVIDYKTRPSFISAWDGVRPAEPQLPIYAAHLQAGAEVLSGVFFAIVRKGDEAFRGVTVSDKIVPGVAPGPDDPPLDERIAEWRHALEGLGEQFRQGLAMVDPRDGFATCRHCNLSAFCRIQDTVGGPSVPPDDVIPLAFDREPGARL